jgi:hypothetical protein
LFSTTGFKIAEKFSAFTTLYLDTNRHRPSVRMKQGSATYVSTFATAYLEDSSSK